jgi:uncharacterized protein YqjF (DUF2071 family)
MRFPKHPLAVRTVFRRCFLVNFAVDPSELNSVLPGHVIADVYGDEAFVSVVVGEMEKMRPVGVPRPFGITYNQIVYRAVVRCGDERCVHFLRSDADSATMTMLGNLMSFFRFHHSVIRVTDRGGAVDLDVRTHTSPSADIAATFRVDSPSTELPVGSAFPNLSEATRWLVELYAAFDHTEGHTTVDVVRIKRGAWDVRVVDDTRADYAFMSAGAPFSGARLDSVLSVGDVPYHWHRLQKRAITERAPA